MTLSQIKTSAGAILGMANISEWDVLGEDMFLIAANNAIREAQLLHNFEYTRIRGVISVPGTLGASLSGATIEGGEITLTGSTTPATAGTYTQFGNYNGHPAWNGTVSGTTYFIYFNTGQSSYVISAVLSSATPPVYWIKSTAPTDPLGNYDPDSPVGTPVATASNARLTRWKEVVVVSRTRPDGSYQPIDFTRSDIAFERDRTELEFSDDQWPLNRYPSDADVLAGAAQSTVAQLGGKLYIHPRDVTATQALDLNLEGYGWLKEYVTADLSATEPVDFLVEFGAQYILWSAVIEGNLITKTFVPRTEGNLGPPQDAKDAAWRKLLLWDSYLVDANVTRSR